MKANLQRDLSDLIDEGILNQDTADRIRRFYANREKDAPNRFLLVSALLGATLIGLGVILIIAHNWDQLPQAIKTIFAFAPLLIAQGLCGYTLYKKQESVAWRESSAILLFFAVAASISLISQIYNVMGEMESFLLTWMALSLPIIYIMRSSMVSLLYIAGITSYGMMIGYENWQHEMMNWYWPLMVLLLPYYYFINRDKPNSGFTVFHHLFIPGSVAIIFGSLLQDNSIWIIPTYMSLFGMIYLFGHASWIKQDRYTFNGYQLVGALGTVCLLLALSFHAYWKSLLHDYEQVENLFSGYDWVIVTVLLLAGIGLLIQQQQRGQLSLHQPIKFVFLAFLLIFFLGLNGSILPVVVTNLLTLTIGIYYVHWGTRDNSLTLTNYGLLIITLLIICRFFDTNISFVVRGLLFIAIGAGFFLANYRLVQQRKLTMDQE